MKFKILTALVLVAASFSAQAVPVTSSTSAYTTTRDCVSGVTVCDFVSATVHAQAGGLPGDQSATATLSEQDYGTATGTAELTGGVGAMALTGDATSLSGKRNSTNTYGLQRYTYTGAGTMTFTFEGVLTFDQTVPAENAVFDPLSPGSSTRAVAFLEIFSLSDPFLEAGVSEFDNFLTHISGYSSAPGYSLLAQASAGSTTNVTESGSEALSVSVNLNTNDTIWLRAALQTPVANGAFMNASFVTTSNAPVPAPGGVALLAFGLAVLGFRRMIRKV